MFKHIDVDFVNYLGFNVDCLTDFNLFKQEILRNDSHEVYLVYKGTEIVGLVYMYGTHLKYKRCNLGIGLSTAYRGTGLGKEIIEDFTSFIVSKYDFTRIGVEIEDSNIASLRMINGLSDFKYEGKLLNNYGVGIHSNVYAMVR